MHTDDFFRSRLDQMIDLRYPLAVLALTFAHKHRPGKVFEKESSGRVWRKAERGRVSVHDTE
jgi:hypothetical protein